MEHFAAYDGDPDDQVFFGLLDHAAHGELPDEASQFADNLQHEVDDTQSQTDQAISDAEHSPGFGEVNPHTAAVLRAYGLGGQIQASEYQDWSGRQAETAQDEAVTSSDLAVGDAQAALDTPDGTDV
jgi:hypothetical protein